MLGRVFKAYDIRGVYPDLLTDEMAWQIGYGTSRFLLQAAKAAGDTSPMMRNIVVGRDMRKSSPSLSAALIQGIRDQGGDVIDVGLVDTPFVYFAINHLDCAGGVMTTASHNPPQYNGFKISERRARPVGEASGLALIRKHAAMVDRAVVRPAGGRVEKRDLWSAYARHVRSFLDLSSLGKRVLRVVVDASNGMAGTMIPRVFGARGSDVPGLEIIELNFENARGVFAHEPNPLIIANLLQVRSAVVEHGADFGVCFDGDADRCVAVDEKGRVVGCDHLTAVLARHMLARARGSAVIYDLRSTRAVAEEIVKAGGRPVRGRVGHVFIKHLMEEHGAVFGGELSGHFYFRDNFNADSGAIALATLLTVVARSGASLGALVRPVARYAQSGEINFRSEEPDAALAALVERFGPESKSAGETDDLDGVTIDCFRARGWWCNVRKSNTEPLLRLNAEAKTETALRRIIGEVAPRLGQKVEH
jgi:phosphomannomutase